MKEKSKISKIRICETHLFWVQFSDLYQSPAYALRPKATSTERLPLTSMGFESGSTCTGRFLKQEWPPGHPSHLSHLYKVNWFLLLSHFPQNLFTPFQAEMISLSISILFSARFFIRKTRFILIHVNFPLLRPSLSNLVKVNPGWWELMMYLDWRIMQLPCWILI